MPKKNKDTRETVSVLIGTLSLLLAVNVIVVFIMAIIEFSRGSVGLSVGLLLGAIFDGFLLGLLISLFSDAFYSIADRLDKLEGKSEKASVDSKEQKPKTISPIATLHEIEDDTLKGFCQKVDALLKGETVERQLGLLVYLLKRRQERYAQETDPAQKGIYGEQVDYIRISIAALEKGN